VRAGGEPFGEIMAAVSALTPGQGLRLYATFKPTPLLHVLGSKGFTSETKELEGGEWEVLFSPSGAPATNAAPAKAAAPDNTAWSEPLIELDNRELDPPEPMVRILATVEAMKPGEVMTALLRREPLFLFPELAKRGHSWHGAFEPDGKTYKIFIRVGAAKGAAA
jgi:uncharacterized protein (DUF2249 family)